MKKCSRCGMELEVTQFARMTKAPDGLQRECRACTRARRAAGPVKLRTVTEKRCSKCGEVKTASQFHRRRQSGTGLEHECKTCKSAAQRADRAKRPGHYRQRGLDDWKKPERRDRYYQRQYGITLARYEEMILEQGGLCFVCRRAPDNQRGKKLHVDHCHLTGKVRRLLCNACNAAIAHAGDNPELLEELARYLRAHKE